MLSGNWRGPQLTPSCARRLAWGLQPLNFAVSSLVVSYSGIKSKSEYVELDVLQGRSCVFWDSSLCTYHWLVTTRVGRCNTLTRDHAIRVNISHRFDFLWFFFVSYTGYILHEDYSVFQVIKINHALSCLQSTVPFGRRIHQWMHNDNIAI